MKILHVTESRGWSGGTVQLWNLSQTLRAQGHEVGLFCPPASELLKHAPGSGVQVFTCALRQDYDLRAAWALSKAIRQFSPDIVHAHHPRAHALSLLAGCFTTIKHLVVSRRVSFKLKKWNIFSQLKYRSPQISAYTAVSQDIKNVLVSGGVPAHKIEVIHSGVDVQKFSPQAPSENLRQELQVPMGIPLVGNLNHFSWWKGQSYFLEAAKLVLDEKVPAHFVLAGKDTEGHEAREKVKALGIQEHVCLAGFRTDMPEVISLLKLCVLSSLAGEGFSGVLREAMSMGVPVAATDVGGNRELVVNEKTGLLVPPADAKALAGAIKRMLTDQTLSDACAKQAQDNVRSHYSIGSMVEKTTGLYKQLLKVEYDLGSHG